MLTNYCINSFYNMVDSKDSNPSFFTKHIHERGVNFALIPTMLFTGTVDTLAGVGAGLVAFFTAGKFEKINLFATSNMISTSLILSHLYSNILHTINPSVNLDDHLNGEAHYISIMGPGFLHKFVFSCMTASAKECYDSNNLILSHVVSRIIYIVLGIISPFSRTLDGTIGLIAVPCSIITLGYFHSLNNLAFRTLQFPGLIMDIYYCAVKFINPWARSIVD